MGTNKAKELLCNKFNNINYEEELFHYTSPQGFCGILFSNDHVNMRASRFDCLNDYSEGEIVYKIYKQVCSDLLQENKISQNEYDDLSKLSLNDDFVFEYENTDSKVMPYIASFSKKCDSLAMWNHYTKGSKFDGFNVSFEGRQIKKELNSILSNMNYEILEVIYGMEEQYNIIKNNILKILEVDNEYRTQLIRKLLLEFRLVFKKECFRHEAEVRLVIYVPESTFQIEYRYANSLMIPYINIDLSKESVVGVTFSPLSIDRRQKLIQKDILEERLKKNNYKAKVMNSNIPVRY